MSENEQSRTIFCGNLHDNVTEDLLYELFLQGGPLEKVFIPKDKTGRPRNFGFIVYAHQMSVPYAIILFAQTNLFNRRLNLQLAGPKKQLGDNKANQNQANAYANQNQPRTERNIDISSALRQGFQQSLLNRNMLPNTNVNQSGSAPVPNLDPNILLQLGQDFLFAGYQSNDLNARDQFKMTNRDERHHRSHNDPPYNRSNRDVRNNYHNNRSNSNRNNRRN